MPARKRSRTEKKAARTERPKHREPVRKPEPVIVAPEPQPETDDFDLSDLPAELPNGGEPDPRVVDSVTDRIFASVLSRYGWEKHNGRIEHVGEERRH